MQEKGGSKPRWCDAGWGSGAYMFIGHFPLLRLVATLAFLTTADAHAQAYIGGRVVDRQQRTPLAHLTVELLGARDTVLHTAVSATGGTFTLVAPGGGVYRVRFVVDGVPTHVSDTLGVTDGEYAAREFTLDMSQRPLPEKDVDKPVIPVRGSPQPRYPEELRRAGISGCVLAQFISRSGNDARARLQ